MKFTIQDPLKDYNPPTSSFHPSFSSGWAPNIYRLMRKIGYYFLEQEKGNLSFVKPLEKSGYPRFHIYLKVENENLIFNLHLDQKRPIYKGAPAHAGESEGKIVEKEAERIKQIITQ